MATISKEMLMGEILDTDARVVPVLLDAGMEKGIQRGPVSEGPGRRGSSSGTG